MKFPSNWLDPERRLAREMRLHSAISVLAAIVIAVSGNWWSLRHVRRWDVTSNRLYTLTAPTRQTLHGLSAPVRVYVFLSQSDPQIGAVTQLLDQYKADSSLFEVEFVDPDRNPAQFVAVHARYELSEGRAEQGHLVSDAALLVVSGRERWVIPPSRIADVDFQTGRIKPLLEQSLTEGIRQVLHPQVTRACFSEGHGEPSVADPGPDGLAGLAQMLAKNNFDTEGVSLGDVGSPLALERCDLLVVVAPERPFGAESTARIVSAAQRGLNVLLAMGPMVHADAPAGDDGLGSLLQLFSLQWGKHLVFERDPQRALPNGLGGEVFFAHPRSHAITAGLLREGEVQMPVLVQLAQAVSARPEASHVASLLTTSASAFGVDAHSLLAAGPSVPVPAVDDLPRDTSGPFSIAMVSELSASSGGRSKRGARLLALGSSRPLVTKTWRDPSLAGTRRFSESAVAWLASRPSLVSVPEKPGRKTASRLTEASLGAVARYVLVYMPGTALLIGILLLLRRRKEVGPRAVRSKS